MFAGQRMHNRLIYGISHSLKERTILTLLQSCDLTGQECHGACQDIIDQLREHPCFTEDVDDFVAGVAAAEILEQMGVTSLSAE